MENRILAFADAHLQPYRLRNDELIPESCPFCGGGENNDQESFAVNIQDGLYKCMRGTCGAQGRFEQLAARFGERAGAPDPGTRHSGAKSKKQFAIPDTALLPMTEEAIRYFDSRKIGRETLDAYGIASDEKGNIVFPFYRDGKLVYVKYRKPRKPEPKEPKEWQFPGAQPILFGMDLCSFALP